MKNKALIIISLSVTLVLAGYLFKNRKGGKKEINYKTVQTKLHDLNVMIQSTGSVEPMNKVQIMPPVSGRMEKILIQEGQMVERGEVIGQMSSTNRAALLDVARSMKKRTSSNGRKFIGPPLLLRLSQDLSSAKGSFQDKLLSSKPSFLK